MTQLFLPVVLVQFLHNNCNFFTEEPVHFGIGNQGQTGKTFKIFRKLLTARLISGSWIVPIASFPAYIWHLLQFADGITDTVLDPSFAEGFHGLE